MSSPSERFKAVFRDVIGIEGGYVNSPNDPGGETKFGISKRSYPNLDIKNLTLAQAYEIYWTDFWCVAGCDRITEVGLDRFVFDFAVNSGVGTVVRKLQAAVGTLADGKFGPNTLRALLNSDANHVVRVLFVERAIIFASAQPNVFQENCHGWYARLHDVTKRCYEELEKWNS